MFPKNTIIGSSSVEIKPFFYSSRVNTSSPVLITVIHGNVFCSQTCAKQEYLLSMLEKCPSSNYISFPYSLLENHSLTWLTSQKKSNGVIYPRIYTVKSHLRKSLRLSWIPDMHTHKSLQGLFFFLAEKKLFPQKEDCQFGLGNGVRVQVPCLELE